MARKKTTRPAGRPARGNAKPFEHAVPFEAEVLRGLAPFAERELGRLPGVRELRADGQESVRWRYQGDWRKLQELRTAVAVYALRRFEVPRPKALLGHQNLRALLELVGSVRAYDPGQRFESFRFGAAGSASSVFERLAAEIASATGLRYDPDEGELLLRVRPHAGAWEALARITPRPLSARAWRVCNMAGGLNATVAAAMHLLAGVRPRDRVLNAMCGSGTLLAERWRMGPTSRLVGADIDAEALGCARENLAAAGATAAVELCEADATALPFAAGSFELVVADLPWGDAVGSAEANARLYPAFLREAARVAADGRLLVLTHAIRQFEALLAAQSDWKVAESLQVYHGGHHPKAYLLDRQK